jgi:hypothetical protein
MFHFTSIIYTAGRNTSSSKNVHQVIPQRLIWLRTVIRALFVAMDMLAVGVLSELRRAALGRLGPGVRRTGHSNLGIGSSNRAGRSCRKRHLLSFRE